jgi:hypothetical protein
MHGQQQPQGEHSVSQKTRTEFTYHYVRNEDVPRWIAVGWVRLGCLDGCVHGYWSALLEWPFETECIIPEKVDGNEDREYPLANVG